MLRGDNVTEIQEMRRSGLSVQKISRLTGFDRKTVRKYLENPEVPVYGPREPRPSVLDPYTDYIDQRLGAGVWNAVVLLRELRERGYTGGYTILKEYLHPRREAAHAVAVRRFETAPGHQAQVDWTRAGAQEFPDGSSRPLSGFAFTLGFSRAMFSDVATDQKLGTFLALHEAAFHELGGIPREVLYDRVKTVVLDTDHRGETVWNPTFLDFARYWGFRPRLCAPYRAQTKGKIENGIGYIRKSFLCAVSAMDVGDLSRQLHSWVWNVANRRIHGTTHRVVMEAWEEEKGYLLPVAGRCAYPYVEQESRRVSRDAFVAYQTNRYSVPWQLAWQQVHVQEVRGRVEVFHGGSRVAVHQRASGRHQVVIDPEHHRGMPYGPRGGRAVKAMVTIPAAAEVNGHRDPVVEVRPLSVYEAMVEGASPMSGGGS